MGSLSASPDVSPISTTSALMTPPELSPAKGYGEWKFNPNYDFGPAGYQQPSNNALLFETDPQNRYQELLAHSPYRSSAAHSADPFRSIGRTVPGFEPFSEASLYAQGSGLPRIDTSTVHRQDAALLNPSWSHQRLRTSSSDWTKADDRRIFESAVSDVNMSPTHGSRSHATPHEVNIRGLPRALRSCSHSHDSRSTFFRSCTPRRARRTTCLSRASSSRPTSKPQSSSSRS